MTSPIPPFPLPLKEGRAGKAGWERFAVMKKHLPLTSKGEAARAVKSKTSPIKKHIPQRTCIGCREVESKRELMRIVRTPEGQVLADPTGKKSGRGAYLHKERECWDTALRSRGRLEHALKLEGSLAPEDRAALEELGSRFPPRAIVRAKENTHAPSPLQ
jgi:predicted RNA-binding protein YlxR (DUF448 family)